MTPASRISQPLLHDVFHLPLVKPPFRKQLVSAIFLFSRLTCSYLLQYDLTVQQSPSQLQAEQGIEALRAGDLSAAEQQLRLAVKSASDNAFYLSTLASILGMQQKLPEASSYFEKAVRIDPGNAKVRRDLAATQW